MILYLSDGQFVRCYQAINMTRFGRERKFYKIEVGLSTE